MYEIVDHDGRQLCGWSLEEDVLDREEIHRTRKRSLGAQGADLFRNHCFSYRYVFL